MKFVCFSRDVSLLSALRQEGFNRSGEKESHTHIRCRRISLFLPAAGKEVGAGGPKYEPLAAVVAEPRHLFGWRGHESPHSEAEPRRGERGVVAFNQARPRPVALGWRAENLRRDGGRGRPPTCARTVFFTGESGGAGAGAGAREKQRASLHHVHGEPGRAKAASTANPEPFFSAEDHRLLGHLLLLLLLLLLLVVVVVFVRDLGRTGRPLLTTWQNFDGSQQPHAASLPPAPPPLQPSPMPMVTISTGSKQYCPPCLHRSELPRKLDTAATWHDFESSSNRNLRIYLAPAANPQQPAASARSNDGAGRTDHGLVSREPGWTATTVTAADDEALAAGSSGGHGGRTRCLLRWCLRRRRACPGRHGAAGDASRDLHLPERPSRRR